MSGEATILWDLDGTLTNPFLGITRSIAFALRELGRDPPHLDELRRYIGPPLQTTFPRLLDSDDAGLADEALRLYRMRYSETGKFENEVIPGIPEALAALKQTKARMFVATSKLEHYSVEIVDHFGLTSFFERVYGSQFDGSRADKGDLIRHIIETEGLRPDRTVMIGDRLHDVHGAGRNDVKTIGVLWGFGDRPELEEAGAVLIAGQPADLPSLAERALG